MALRLTFYGGAEEITGSNFLVEGDKGRVLVDCGIEQGSDFLEQKVYGPFPYDPLLIDALVVTHAHLDHIGRIPKLVKDGFKNKIYMTPPTKDLAELILRDSTQIFAEDARHRGHQPLYEEKDVTKMLSLIEPLEYHCERTIAPGLSVYLRDTGHVLGSASVRIRSDSGETIAFTGDLGNSPSPLLPDWEPVPDADALVMDSVYGDKLHPPRAERVAKLLSTLKVAISRGGAILIPAFSMERTQLMLYELSNFFASKELPKVPVFLDSPLAIKVTNVYEKWGPTYFKKAAEDEMRQEGSLFEFPFLTKTLSHVESEKIREVPGPKIIIAGAGMSYGGRIAKWETEYLPDPKTTLLIVGYQAPGSPGRRMSENARSAHINGLEVKIRAHIELIEGWSAHADRDSLLEFAESALPQPKAIFTVLGEPASERYLSQRLHDYLGVRAIAPLDKQTWIITPHSVERAK